ncbi:hypothetical protein NB231_12449 [Nitrococcus mobilis Nb-231]|uniref:Uncharacterized protein n=1 Tax=Nitrococcus mobilis Nb-231 TaxID=314278 RepID=A4BPP7_9GAMM|nr:hypothetical protein NB231_12449 [Nitrococcus mobilis Nb-231]
MTLVAPASSASDLAAYFPSETGRTWRYSTVKQSTLTAGPESRKSEKRSEVAEKVRGPSEHGSVAVSRVVNEQNATMGQVRVESVIHVRVGPDAISVVAIELPRRGVQTLSPAQPLLLRTVPGPNVEGLQSSLRLTTRLSSQSPSKTESPLGLFPDCIVTETTGSVSGYLNGAPVTGGSIVVNAWYARGVGLVREERTLDFSVSAPNGPSIRLQEVATKLLEESTLP